MAKNNIDKKIKTSLEERRLNPAEESWEKLSERLHHKEQKSSRKYWLMGMAASFLVGILLTSLVFQQKDEQPATPSVVLQEKENNDTLEKATRANEKMAPSTQPQQEVAVAEASTATEKKQNERPRQQTTPQVPSREMHPKKVRQKNKAIAEGKPGEPPQKPEGLVEETSSRILDNLKQKHHGDSIQVTDAEIDQLIREATMNIKASEIFGAHSNHVNAQALLENVENEVTRSFHERVFEAVQKGLQQVKTAVANRNF